MRVDARAHTRHDFPCIHPCANGHPALSGTDGRTWGEITDFHNFLKKYITKSSRQGMVSMLKSI